jgi:hypothetical protein
MTLLPVPMSAQFSDYAVEYLTLFHSKQGAFHRPDKVRCQAHHDVFLQWGMILSHLSVCAMQR